jgi:hypothetical protein
VQGLEREVIIVDLTITRQLGFLSDPARLLVALSRPRSMLIVIGNMGSTQRYRRSTVSQLIEHCKQQNFKADVTGKLADAWQTQFVTAEDLGSRRIAFSHDHTLSTNLLESLDRDANLGIS